MKNLFPKILFCTVLLSLGCSGDPGKYPDPTEFSGKVVGPTGGPISGVKIFFQPTGNTPTAFGVVGNGGAFTTKVVPGEYVVYFEPRQAADDDDQEAVAASWALIPAKYREPQKDNTVKVTTSPIEIKLNP